MESLTPAVLFEDQHLIVLSKPAALLSQGAIKSVPNLVDWLRDYLGRSYVGLIHRLDRNTSGIMIVAKRTKAARRLTESLKKGTLKRVYLALLCGRLKKPAVWQHWLLKNSQLNRVQAFSKQKRGAQFARLSVKPLRFLNKEGIKLTLAEFELETGRSHQIRAECAAEGMPIFGDTKYGNTHPISSSWRKFKRPALHSWKLSFPHPMTGQILHFEAPLTSDFQSILH